MKNKNGKNENLENAGTSVIVKRKQYWRYQLDMIKQQRKET